jgi:hypothetical protein
MKSNNPSLFFVKYECNGQKYGEGRWAKNEWEAGKLVENYYKPRYPDVKITEVQLIHD